MLVYWRVPVLEGNQLLDTTVWQICVISLKKQIVWVGHFMTLYTPPIFSKTWHVTRNRFVVGVGLCRVAWESSCDGLIWWRPFARWKTSHGATMGWSEVGFLTVNLSKVGSYDRSKFRVHWGLRIRHTNGSKKHQMTLQIFGKAWVLQVGVGQTIGYHG